MEHSGPNAMGRGALKQMGAAFHGATLLAGWSVTFCEVRGARRDLVCDDAWQIAVSDNYTVSLLVICGVNERIQPRD